MRFRDIDVQEDRLTPANLFHVPAGMSPALLATLRAAALVGLSDHEFSDLMHHASTRSSRLQSRSSVVSTKKLVRSFFLDDTFRQRVLFGLPKNTS